MRASTIACFEAISSRTSWMRDASSARAVGIPSPFESERMRPEMTGSLTRSRSCRILLRSPVPRTCRLEARDGGLDRFEDIKRTEQSKEVENSSELGFSTDDNSE